MRFFSISLAVLALFLLIGRCEAASCTYSLVDVRVDKVSAADSKALQTEPQYSESLPEDMLQEPASPLFKVECECRYIARGSSILCTDMSVNQARTIPAADLPAARKLAKSSCDCPGLLSQ